MQGIGREIRTAIALLGLAVLLAGCMGTASGPGGVDALTVTQVRGDTGKLVPFYDVNARSDDGAPTEKLVLIAMRRSAEMALENDEKVFALVDKLGAVSKLNLGGGQRVVARQVVLRIAIGTAAVAAVVMKKGKDAKLYEARDVIVRSNRRLAELESGSPPLEEPPQGVPDKGGQDI